MRDEATQAAVDATIATAASKATYTGAGMTIGGWVLSSEFAVLVGLILGVAGFIVNWYYRHKQDRREQVEHERRMRDYEDPK
jgi:ABC-type transport system involved in cytochrome bd biosynthesis fused ATPase/permease subunit